MLVGFIVITFRIILIPNDLVELHFSPYPARLFTVARERHQAPQQAGASR